MSHKPLSPEERHQIVIDYVNEHKKLSLKVFHLRWNEGELITKKVLTTTPAFWYKRYGWRRKKLENLFLKTQIEVSGTLENGLDEVYGGGYKGKRWINNSMIGKLDNLWEKLHAKKANNQNIKAPTSKSSDAQQQQNEDANDQKLQFSEFLNALKINEVTISDKLAKQIFEGIDVNNNGFITKSEMEQCLTNLDAINFDGIVDLANNEQMLNLCMTKKVMDCLLSDDGLQFVEMEFIADLKSNIEFNDPECLAYLNKLGDRDVAWDLRIDAMAKLDKGITSGKYDIIMKDDDQVTQLMFGIATQLLDDVPQVQAKAIEIVPNLLDECFQKAANINVVYDHLPELIDNFFVILDNPKFKMNHQNVKYGMDDIIDNIINTQHPVAVLQLAKIFSGKCKLENINNPETRNVALQNLSKIMFSCDSPYLTFDKAQIKAPVVEEDKLPQKGDNYREWLDTATSHQPGPSVRYMNQNADRLSRKRKKHRSGGQNELVLGYGKIPKNKDNEYENEEDEKEELIEGPVDYNRLSLCEYSSEQIGTEFVDAVSNGLSAAMMDPNRSNKIHAFKTNNILNQLAPEFSENLEKESKRRYDQWDSGDLQPYNKGGGQKELPKMKKIEPKLVTLATNTKISTNLQPTLADI